MSKPNDSDPRKVLFWYRDQYVLYWEKLDKVDNKWHEWLYARFPKSIQFGGTILRWLYRGAISPAFAVILTLLLVGLVITGVVPLILSISVFTAWLVAVLSLAKSNWVNRLRIVRRVMIVLAGWLLLQIAMLDGVCAVIIGTIQPQLPVILIRLVAMPYSSSDSRNYSKKSKQRHRRGRTHR